MLYLYSILSIYFYYSILIIFYNFRRRSSAAWVEPQRYQERYTKMSENKPIKTRQNKLKHLTISMGLLQTLRLLTAIYHFSTSPLEDFPHPWPAFDPHSGKGFSVLILPRNGWLIPSKNDAMSCVNLCCWWFGHSAVAAVRSFLMSGRPYSRVHA